MSDYRGIAPMEFGGNLAENWKLWRQKFENYAVATEMGKKDEKIQIAQLLHYIGEEGFLIYNTFTLADEERNKLKVVLDKFEHHFSPKKNLSYERYKFFTRKQMLNETIEQFMTDLKNKSRSCEFGDLKDSLIKDIFTCGLQNQTLKEKLLQDDEMDVDQAEKLCITVESSKQQSNVISQGSSFSLSKVQAIQKSRSHNCSRNGGSNKMSHMRQQMNNFTQQSTSSGSETRLRENSGVCYRCGSVHGKNLKPIQVDFHKYNKHIQSSQMKQKLYYNSQTKNLKPIKNNQNVIFQDKLKSKWQFGKVIDRPRNRSYLLQKKDGSKIRRNRRFIETLPNSSNNDDIIEISDSDESHQSTDHKETFGETSLLDNEYKVPDETSSGRRIKKPDRLMYF